MTITDLPWLSHDCRLMFTRLSDGYHPQIENDAGKWVKLSGEALEQFECQGAVGYALSYSSERKQYFLEEKEVGCSTHSLVKQVYFLQDPLV